MTNKIDDQLRIIVTSKRTGLMTHVVVGYPTLNATVPLVRGLELAGSDFIELQIPFSDPLADGPTIQKACEVALSNGTRVRDAFIIAQQLKGTVRIPLLFMAYFNTVYKYGVEKFCADAAQAGISGLIIPDAPLEAAQHEGLLDSCERHGLYNILTFAPTSTDQRLKKNAPVAKGFVYCMSRQGVTGAHQGLDPKLQQYLTRVRTQIDVPIAVGFGISNKERLQAIAPHAEVAVIGSAIIDIVSNSPADVIVTNAQAFLRSLYSSAL
jgi:tryptophan synthase alpha chain